MQVAIYIRVYVITGSVGFSHIGDSRFLNVKRRRLALYTRAFVITGNVGLSHIGDSRFSSVIRMRLTIYIRVYVIVQTVKPYQNAWGTCARRVLIGTMAIITLANAGHWQCCTFATFI